MDRLLALVLLRWRMDVRTLRWARERMLGVLLMVPGLLLFSALGSLAVLVAVRGLDRNDPDALLPLLSALATGAGLFWALSPLLAGAAFTESHDLGRLLHFPIPLPTLVLSSLLANLTQPVVLAEVPILLALGVALSSSVLLWPLVMGGLFLSFAFVLAAAHVVGLVLQALSRNRRLHDFALFIALAAGFGFSFAPIVILGSNPGPVLRFVLRHDPFAFSPFAWGVRSAVFLGRGDLPAALLPGGAALLALLAAVAGSTLLVERMHRGELDFGGEAAADRAPRARMVFAGPVGALLEKDLRSAWRDPALKAGMLIGLAGPLVFLVFLAQTSRPARASALLLLATFVGLSGFGANVFGFERRGLSLLMSFPVARWRLLVAKNAGSALMRLPGVLVLLLAGGAFSATEVVPAAATAALVGMVISAGVDNFASILFPMAVPEPGRNAYATTGGRGLGAAALAAVMLLITLVVAAPFLFLAWLPLLLELRWLWFASLPLALAGALAVYALLIGRAETLLQQREPDLLERILGEW